MENRKSILFGLIGGFALILLTRLVNVYNMFGVMSGYLRSFKISVIAEIVISVILGILSVVGLITSIYFSILLIFDTLKTLKRNK